MTTGFATQRGIGMVAAIGAILLFSVLGAALTTSFRSTSLSTAEQQSGGDAFAIAETGLNAAALYMEGNCNTPPSPLPFTLTGNPGGGSYVATISNPSQDGITYEISATGSTGNAQRTLAHTVVCTVTTAAGNLFSDDNAEAWRQQDLLNEQGDVTFSDPRGGGGGGWGWGRDNRAHCSNSPGNTSCIRTHNPEALSLPYSPGEENYLSTTFTPPPPEGADLFIKIDFSRENGKVDHIMCVDGDLSAGIGFDLTTTETILCWVEIWHRDHPGQGGGRGRDRDDDDDGRGRGHDRDDDDRGRGNGHGRDDDDDDDRRRGHDRDDDDRDDHRGHGHHVGWYDHGHGRYHDDDDRRDHWRGRHDERHDRDDHTWGRSGYHERVEIESAYDPESGFISINLGEFDPSRITDFQLIMNNLPRGESITLTNPCFGSHCANSGGLVGILAPDGWKESVQ